MSKANLENLQAAWADYRDSVYDDQYLHDPAPYDFGVDDCERAFFAGALALFNLLGDQARAGADPGETVQAVRAELVAYARALKKASAS